MQASTSAFSSPYAWLDETDFYLNGRNRMKPTASGLLSLQDLTVDRERTEYTALKNGVYRACGRVKLTSKQEQAVELAREAIQYNITPTMYVSEKMGMNRFSAWKILNRADMRLKNSNLPKMETSRDFPYYIHRFKPSEADIQRKMASFPVQCAAYGTPDCLHTTTAYWCVCRNCLKEWGLYGEQPQWLISMITLTRKEYRQKAIEALFFEAYGVEIDMDLLMDLSLR